MELFVDYYTSRKLQIIKTYWHSSNCYSRQMIRAVPEYVNLDIIIVWNTGDLCGSRRNPNMTEHESARVINIIAVSLSALIDSYVMNLVLCVPRVYRRFGFSKKLCVDNYRIVCSVALNQSYFVLVSGFYFARSNISSTHFLSLTFAVSPPHAWW